MALDSLLDTLERLPAFQRIVNTLPSPGERLRVSGLPGSAGAAMLATVARRLPSRFFVVAADGVAEAERWLADLETLLADVPRRSTRRAKGSAKPSRTWRSPASASRRSSVCRAASCACW
jgi:hypothetical protein